ncbi:hypothetical protein KJ567_02050, partial [Candidatus Bipolaricaulota bacterium]|nr:hypothetical protein [Candidatus Bipolaricaulota bacterium]
MDRSTEELLEVVQLVGRASTDLHGLTSAQEIAKAVTETFRSSRRFNAHVMMVDDGDETLRFVATSFVPTLVKLGEIIAGVSMSSFRVRLEKSPLLTRVIHEGETLLVSTTDALGQFLPSQIVLRVLKRLRYEGTHDILTPLHCRGRIVGILSVTAPDLAELFVPSMKNLAHLMSAALDYAVSQEERRRSDHRYQ